jgi:hypothetical protein
MEDQRVVINADVHVVGSDQSQNLTAVPNIVVFDEGLEIETALPQKGMKKATKIRSKGDVHSFHSLKT